jgi:hypothetical protein
LTATTRTILRFAFVFIVASQLGGLYIYDPKTDAFLFEYREAYAGDSPRIVDVFDALGVPPEGRQSINCESRIIDLAQEVAKAAHREAAPKALLQYSE